MSKNYIIEGLYSKRLAVNESTSNEWKKIPMSSLSERQKTYFKAVGALRECDDPGSVEVNYSKIPSKTNEDGTMSLKIDEDKWITIKGTHVLVDDKGNIQNEKIRKKIEGDSDNSSGKSEKSNKNSIYAYEVDKSNKVYSSSNDIDDNTADLVHMLDLVSGDGKIPSKKARDIQKSLENIADIAKDHYKYDEDDDDYVSMSAAGSDFDDLCSAASEYFSDDEIDDMVRKVGIDPEYLR